MTDVLFPSSESHGILHCLLFYAMVIHVKEINASKDSDPFICSIVNTVNIRPVPMSHMSSILSNTKIAVLESFLFAVYLNLFCGVRCCEDGSTLGYSVALQKPMREVMETMSNDNLG